MKLVITEKLSVSSTVDDLSNEIADKIVDDVDNRAVMYSPMTNKPYFEGEIIILTSKYFKNIPQIKLSYIMYDVTSVNEYNDIIVNSNIDEISSSSDFDSGVIKIVSGFIGNYTLPDFMSNIMHEVEHLFQYDKGMQKRVSLYDDVIWKMRYGDAEESIIARALYYTFTHEQDAFANQFYGFLSQETPYGNFEDLLRYSEYRNAENAINAVKKIDKKILKKKLLQFGMTIEIYNKRVHFALKRMKSKMSNVFKRYKYDTQGYNGLREMSRQNYYMQLCEMIPNIISKIEERYCFRKWYNIVKN